MKIIILTFLILALVYVPPAFSANYIGGNFAGGPELLNQEISNGAKQLIKEAYKGVKDKTRIDHHVHILGTDERQGTYVNPRLLFWYNVIDRFKTSIYLSGSQITDLQNSNAQYLDRLVQLIRADKNHGKYHILGFDRHYNKDGTINEKYTEFYVSNEYIYKLYQTYPDIFVPVISIHPYRKDALVELEKWANKGMKWMKWLPNSQGMDPSDPKIDAYYRLMKKHNMILLTHAGKEEAVKSTKALQALGNPLLFRRPLDLGVTVVLAHCASLADNEDLDNPGKRAPNIDLFLRMMDNPAYKGKLYGEISGMTLFKRVPDVLAKLLTRPDIFHRLGNGSDYPLPALNIVIHTRALARHGFITKQERKYLNEIYKYNPLLFDFVVKRTLRHPKTGVKFSPLIFTSLEERIKK